MEVLRRCFCASAVAFLAAMTALAGCGTESGGGDEGACLPAAVAATPSMGTAKGGTEVRLSGRCLGADVVVRVWVGDRVGEVTGQDDRELRFVTPAGVQGTAELRAEREDGRRVRLDATFAYLGLAPTFAVKEGAVPPETVDVRDGVAEDFDGDGDLDVVFAVRGMLRPLYLENDGTGAFTDASETKLDAPPLDAIGIAAGDVDGDGDMDVVVGSFEPAVNDVLLRNDGQGRLVQDPVAITADGARDDGAVLVDVDGDDDLDVVSATWGGADRVLVNDGGGNFTPKADALPARDETTPGVAAADLNGDGHIDLAFAVQAGGPPLRLLLGDGAGAFQDPPAGTVGEGSLGPLRRPAIGDLNGDGRPDIAVAGTGGYDVLLQSELGRFLWSTTVLGVTSEAAQWNGVTLFDVDLDGDLDLLLAGEGVPVRFFENDGGVLMRRDDRMPASATRQSRHLLVADFTGDGAPDILVTEGADAQTELLASDGKSR